MKSIIKSTTVLILLKVKYIKKNVTLITKSEEKNHQKKCTLDIL